MRVLTLVLSENCRLLLKNVSLNAKKFFISIYSIMLCPGPKTLKYTDLDYNDVIYNKFLQIVHVVIANFLKYFKAKCI